MAASSSKMSRFDLPGLNLPLNWTPQPSFNRYEYNDDKLQLITTEFPAQGDGQNLFPVALSDADVTDGRTCIYLTTLREFTMLRIMNALTDKPGWEEKVSDDSIAEKWKTEAMSTEGQDVSQNMVDWIIKELRWKAMSFKETGAITVYNGGVVKSDTAIPESVKNRLQEQARKLEDIPDVYKDYHPGSDGKVLDLVHPSIFPLIYGTSRVLKDSLVGLDDCIQSCGRGDIIPVRGEGEEHNNTKSPTDNHRASNSAPPYSRDFQWLPCEVDITGGNARITSYINNLHPQNHTDLYSIIGTVISKTLPLWNTTLTALNDSCGESWRIKYDLEFNPDPEDVVEEDGPQRGPNEDEDDYWERREAWADDYRKAVPADPDPANFAPNEEPEKTVNLVDDYAHRGLQIIVKLANIELTPESPDYEGGSWHVEGQLNEHICATALYYYDNENIMTSELAFRQQSDTDEASEMHYPQGVHGWLNEIFGCENYEAAVQDVGSVVCSEGRLLTFSNILQHQVQPFSLADPTKPGHRKILALFLVDPGIRVISTANVPPQQKAWWSEEVDKQTVGSGIPWEKLSTEMKDNVFRLVDDFPISMEKAKELRLMLMEERKSYAPRQDRQFMRNEFSLCEH